jgi:hypothetical protein
MKITIILFILLISNLATFYFTSHNFEQIGFDNGINFCGHIISRR